MPATIRSRMSRTGRSAATQNPSAAASGRKTETRDPRLLGTERQYHASTAEGQQIEQEEVEAVPEKETGRRELRCPVIPLQDEPCGDENHGTGEEDRHHKVPTHSLEGGKENKEESGQT